MIRQVFLLVAFILSVPVSTTDNIPHVLLTGTGENEIAPHGEGNIYAPSVLIDGHLWKMWYGGQGKYGHDRISYAESTDGRKWNRVGVVLEDKTANHINLSIAHQNLISSNPAEHDSVSFGIAA